MDEFQQNCFNAGAPMAATTSTVPPPPPLAQKKRRRQQITDDDDVEVIALSAEEINAPTMFPCELCDKSFNREQNLILHRRAHNIPYVRKNRPVKNDDDEKRKVYVCPETTCPHHDRPDALCDLTSLKKHFKRKHGEKTMTCNKCFKMYAVEADLRAHLKICGTKEYACVCGSVFSRRDSYMTHKVPCDIALARQLSLLRNEYQISQTTVGRLFVPHIFDDSISYPNKQPALNSNTTTSADSFPFLSDTILVPSFSNLSASNQSVHGNMSKIDPANNSSTQGTELNDNIFDVNVLHDRLFGIPSVPATALTQEAPQGYSLSNSGISASFLGSLENSAAASSDKNNFNVYLNISGTYEIPDQLRYHGNNVRGNVFNLQDEAMQGRDALIGHYWNTPVDENIFNISLEDKATQNGGPSGSGIDQINQLEQLPGHRVCGDAKFPVLQNDFHFWKNLGN